MYSVNICGTELTLETLPGIFSPSGADAGTLLMLSHCGLNDGDRVLDLGCGCGIVGIYAAKRVGAERVTMCDIQPEAVSVSRKNAEANGVGGVEICLSDGLKDLPRKKYTLILTNPPYHADFSVPKRFISEGFEALEPGGRMVAVTKRLDWYKNRFCAVFGGVRVISEGGYYVFIAEKRVERCGAKKPKPRAGMSRKLRRKYGARS